MFLLLHRLPASYMALGLPNARIYQCPYLHWKRPIGGVCEGFHDLAHILGTHGTQLCIFNTTHHDIIRKAALRYLLVHIVGGLVLLAGIIMHAHATGSMSFDAIGIQNTATWLMLIGLLVNAAAVPFSSWLSDAYPKSTIMGGVILSAFTTKTAVYALLRGFPGWDSLIWFGVVMAIFGVVYAVYENDIRRILAFSIINQGGFMVCAVGIGSPLALAGSAAHDCCIIYTALLWMASGAVIHRTGKSNCTEWVGFTDTCP